MDSIVQQATRKAARRLMPFLMLLYLIAYLDRTNIGLASLTMNAEIGISPAEFGFAGSVFFWGYFLCEVPSNLLLTRFGVPAWMGRIMITWGLASAATALVVGANSLYAFRIILGIAEAGFFPGIVIYLMTWFPASERGKMLTFFQVAAPLSGVIGAPLSGLILTYLNGAMGLAGWKWLFIIEGLPAVVLGLICFKFLQSRPAKAEWLTPEERSALQAQLDREQAEKEAVRKYTALEGLLTPRILLLSVFFFCVIMGAYGTGLWLPQIIKTFGYSNETVSYLTAIPNLCAVIVMIPWALHADRTGERIWHVLLPLCVAAVGFIGASLTLTNPVVAITFLSLAVLGLYCAIPLFWMWPTAILTGAAAAGAVALINSGANLSGLVGPWLIGISVGRTGSFAAAMAGIGVLLLVAVALGFFLTRDARIAARAAATS